MDSRRVEGEQNEADVIEGLSKNGDKEADATCCIFALAPRSHVRCLALLLILPRVPISSIVVLFALTRLMWCTPKKICSPPKIPDTPTFAHR